MKQYSREELIKIAAELRYLIAKMIGNAGAGHIGGCLSLVEILTSLYWDIMRVNPDNPRWEDRDRLVLSKGHGGPAVYATLARRGFFPIEELETLNKNGTNLPSHCDMLKTPGIDMTAGSLGQGLSAACGIALSARLDNKDYRTFCIVGDGELNEGQIWEAAMFAAHRKLDNLVAICDCNKLQIDGYTKDILNTEPLVDKWRSFNWDVFQMNGHDLNDIQTKIQKAVAVKGKPAMIIADTLKAKGVTGLENQVACHHVRFSEEQKTAMLNELVMDF